MKLAIELGRVEPDTLKPTSASNQTLAESNVFNLYKIVVEAGEFVCFEAGAPKILSVVSGSLKESDGAIINAGTNALLPAREDFDFLAVERCEILLTQDFVNSAEHSSTDKSPSSKEAPALR